MECKVSFLTTVCLSFALSGIFHTVQCTPNIRDEIKRLPYLNINTMTIQNELNNVTVDVHYDGGSSGGSKPTGQDQLMQLLNLLSKTESFKFSQKKNKELKKAKKLMAFKWTDCGGQGELIKPQGLAVGPDPIALPGNISFKFAANITKTVPAPIQMELKLQKKEGFFWLTIPCIDDLGSCTYKDVCAKLAKAKCPPDFAKHGIPCKCPFQKGSYSIPTETYKVDQSIPSGEYRIKVNLSSAGAQVMCLQLSATVK